MLRNQSHFRWKELNSLSIDEKKRDAHVDSSSRPITQLYKKVARKWTINQAKKTMASAHCAGTKAAYVVDELVIPRNKTRESPTM